MVPLTMMTPYSSASFSVSSEFSGLNPSYPLSETMVPMTWTVPSTVSWTPSLTWTDLALGITSVTPSPTAMSSVSSTGPNCASLVMVTVSPLSAFWRAV